MKYFGTDGIRGVVGKALTPSLIGQIATAIATFLQHCHPEKRKIILGRDTRKSGEEIENIFCQTLTSHGIEIIRIGVAPTAAVSFLVPKLGADLGIMITASHNPPEFNGIKLFESTGEKLNPKDTETIDGMIDEFNYTKLWENYLVEKFSGIKVKEPISIDCNFGSGHTVAKNVCDRLGIDVLFYNYLSNGNNINTSGWTDATFTFDGDADRCVMNGMDGSTVLAALAVFLKVPTLVTTAMFNLGAERWLSEKGIKVYKTRVGDRYVYEKMKELNAQLGGEPSGHIIIPNMLQSGDGLLAALQILQMIGEQGMPEVPLYPSVTKNIPSFEMTKEFDAYVKALKLLHSEYFILIRQSGTEPLTRIMVQGADATTCQEILDMVATRATLNAS